MMKMEEPPPCPNFLASVYAVLMSLLVLANDSLNDHTVEIFLPPFLPLPLMLAIVSLLIILASVDTTRFCLINRLFPNFHGRKTVEGMYEQCLKETRTYSGILLVRRRKQWKLL